MTEGSAASEPVLSSGAPRRLSVKLLALAGSWEDDRDSEEIIRDIEQSRLDAERPELL